eukprot:1537879-Amphidinium_carterae.1
MVVFSLSLSSRFFQGFDTVETLDTDATGCTPDEVALDVCAEEGPVAGGGRRCWVGPEGPWGARDANRSKRHCLQQGLLFQFVVLHFGHVHSGCCWLLGDARLLRFCFELLVRLRVSSLPAKSCFSSWRAKAVFALRGRTLVHVDMACPHSQVKNRCRFYLFGELRLSRPTA